MTTTWLDRPTHQIWLHGRFADLIRFNRNAIRPEGGFHWLDAEGLPLPGKTPQLFLTARMVHVSAVAVQAGIPSAGALLDHGVESLLGLFADTEHGGWFSDPTDPRGRKSTYDHVQVALGASGAIAAGHPRGPELLQRVTAIIDERLYAADEQALRESFAADWSDCEAYRGANANMHGTEAFLALGDVTGEKRWHERALAMAERIINGHARGNGWLIPEHYDEQWQELPDYNRDQPNHPFRPFGATMGHSLEWSRFLVYLSQSRMITPQPWLLESAQALTARALGLWGADGHDGLPYTVDWDDTVVASARLHWPITEGIQTCAALIRVTGDPQWEAWYRRLWDHADRFFIDDSGAWINELDVDLQPKDDIWPGRPDVYHSAGALVVPVLPVVPFMTLSMGATLEGGR